MRKELEASGDMAKLATCEAELTAAMPKGSGRPSKNSSSRGEEFSTKADALSRAKINRNQALQYELMASHPEQVEQAIAEAGENERRSN